MTPHILPDTDLRYWPRKLVPFALEAGWAIHPDSRTGDWAVVMEYVGTVQVAPTEFKRPLVAYAGREA